MPKLSQIVAAAAFVLLTIMLVRKWSGPGAAGPEMEWVPEPPAFESAEAFLKHDSVGKTLRWKHPASREDGSSLSTTELLGYVVVLVPNKTIRESDFESPFEGLNKSEFRGHDHQLNRALSASVLGDFVKKHSDLATVVSATQTNMVVPLDEETLYGAIAAIDVNGLYGALSSTVVLESNGK